MQCSLCTGVALQVVGTGKRQKGFCKIHKPEAFKAAKALTPKTTFAARNESEGYKSGRAVVPHRDYVKHTTL